MVIFLINRQTRKNVAHANQSEPCEVTQTKEIVTIYTVDYCFIY